MEVLKVSSRSVPNAVAGAICGVIRKGNSVEIQAIGAGATNQAVKAVAVARGFLEQEGIELICFPAFGQVTLNDEERTAMIITCEKR